MKVIKKAGKRGMTLIEVLFATALTALVITAGATALQSGMTLYGKTTTHGAQYAAMESAMDAIIAGMRADTEGVRYEGGVLRAGGIEFKNAGGHVVADKDVWVEFATLTVVQEGATLRITITADNGGSVSRVWTLRQPTPL